VRVLPATLSHETIIQNELLLLPLGYDEEDAARELRVDIIIALTHSHDDVAARLESTKKIVATAFKLTLNTRNNMLSIMTNISYEI
jgi:hypothetical protein